MGEIETCSPSSCTLHPSQSEAIPESLKNMLLVMSTQGVLDVSINSSQSAASMAPNKVSHLELTCIVVIFLLLVSACSPLAHAAHVTAHAL